MRVRHLVMAAVVVGACAQTPIPFTGTQREEGLSSRVLGKSLILRVRLPPGYDPAGTQRYPVIVQLDPTYVGLRQMEITVGWVSEAESAGRLPPTLVVGVDYPDPWERMRDYALPTPLDPQYQGAGADRFYRALRDEVVPHLDATLRARADARYLVGHSLGGSFGLYAALRHDPAAPSPFAGVIASDAPVTMALLTYEGLHAARADALPLRLYIARAVLNGPTHRLAHGFLEDRIRRRNYRALTLRTEDFDTDHGGVIEPSYAAGLAFVTEGLR